MPARERLTTGMPIRGSVARRAVFGASLALIFAAAWCSATAYRASALGETRTLSMYNIHTKEIADRHLQARRQVRSGSSQAAQSLHARLAAPRKRPTMDPALIDLIWTLHKQLGSHEPVHLISGLSQRRDQCFAAKEGRRPGQEEPAHPGQGRRHSLPRRRREDAAQLGAGAGGGRRRLLPDLRHSRSSMSIPAMCACGRASRGSSWRRCSPTARQDICRTTTSRSRGRTTSSPWPRVWSTRP